MPRLAKLNHQQLEKEQDYGDQLKDLQHDLLKAQRAYFRFKRRAIILFEGWDASGKGGNIRRLTEKLDPRLLRVHQISVPDPKDQAKHFLYRFWRQVPAPGRIEIFDRSWYGRVMVERVEQLCREEDWQRAYREINEFERTLAANGCRIIKFFLHISKDEQLKRFRKRYENPLKRWKLTADDFRNREKWEEYEAAVEDMVEKCSSVEPWHVVGANHKKAARIQVMRTLIDELTKGLDVSPPPLQPGVKELAERAFHN